MNDDDLILKKFVHKRSVDSTHIFGEDHILIADEIRRIYRNCSYDHRPYLHPKEEALEAKLTEEYRRGHACVKYAVAKVLKPKRLVEIGFGSGTAALAFLAGNPSTHYVGIDNLEWDNRLGGKFIESGSLFLREKGYTFDLIFADSQTLEEIPECNLVHVDGCHLREAALHDMKLAWTCGAEWILVDDCRDSNVVCGIFTSIADLSPGDTSWIYFEDTWAGNILVRRRAL